MRARLLYDILTAFLTSACCAKNWLASVLVYLAPMNQFERLVRLQRRDRISYSLEATWLTGFFFFTDIIIIRE